MGEREEKNDAESSGPEAEAEEAENLGVEKEEEARDVEVESQIDPSQEKEEEMKEEQEEIMKKKYGGLVAKKPPLISKDHERAFFDSADWALGKKSKGVVEALRPKLQPSAHHQARSRSPCAPSADDDLNPADLPSEGSSAAKG